MSFWRICLSLQGRRLYWQIGLAAYPQGRNTVEHLITDKDVNKRREKWAYYCLHCSLYSILMQTFHVFARVHWVFLQFLAPVRPPRYYATLNDACTVSNNNTLNWLSCGRYVDALLRSMAQVAHAFTYAEQHPREPRTSGLCWLKAGHAPSNTQENHVPLVRVDSQQAYANPGMSFAVVPTCILSAWFCLAKRAQNHVSRKPLIRVFALAKTPFWPVLAKKNSWKFSKILWNFPELPYMTICLSLPFWHLPALYTSWCLKSLG